MSFIPKFDPDVFISYKHTDNQIGWISEFHKRLQIRLTEILGQEAAVWRDRKLSGADAFSDEIFKQLENTAVLVSVLTPGYAESKWCQDELREFQKAAAQNGGLRVGNKMRVIKIVKTPMENDQHRHIVSEALGFEFYQHAPGDPDFRELHCDTEKFIDKVDSVAQEICRVLRGM